jgi:hypothetical protein
MIYKVLGVHESIPCKQIMLYAVSFIGGTVEGNSSKTKQEQK